MSLQQISFARTFEAQLDDAPELFEDERFHKTGETTALVCLDMKDVADLIEVYTLTFNRGVPYSSVTIAPRETEDDNSVEIGAR